MQYRKLVKGGDDLSLLGYGCMRLPTISKNIDSEKAMKQLHLAYENGVNYFDTAYLYHGGKSEVFLGEFIKKYDIRKSVYIADKLPAFMVSKKEQLNKFFETQTKRLSTDYIDYYLMHTLDSFESWQKLKNVGIESFIKEKKDNGAIRFVGFSFHGRPEEFIKIIEDYDWDFCQIQYNYLDVNYQAGYAGMKRAHELGIGVVVMEPLRGGNLATNAPDKVKTMLESKGLTPAEIAFRFVMNHSEVAVVLSGMNDESQILENIAVADKTTPNCMGKDELDLIKSIKDVYGELMKVSCTGCGYCMPCPHNVDIPFAFSSYNSKYFFEDSNMSRLMYVAGSAGFMGGAKSGGDSCINCNKCVSHCPQGIDIPTKLKEVHKELNKPILRSLLVLLSKFRRKPKKSKKNHI